MGEAAQAGSLIHMKESTIQMAAFPFKLRHLWGNGGGVLASEGTWEIIWCHLCRMQDCPQQELLSLCPLKVTILCPSCHSPSVVGAYYSQGHSLPVVVTNGKSILPGNPKRAQRSP